MAMPVYKVGTIGIAQSNPVTINCNLQYFLFPGCFKPSHPALHRAGSYSLAKRGVCGDLEDPELIFTNATRSPQRACLNPRVWEVLAVSE